MAEEWIVVPNWDGKDGFQHYRNRDPIWIKNYTRLLAKDEYRALSMHQRGVLHSIWLAYAISNRQLRGSTLTLTRQLGQRVLTRDLVSLSDAGFIQVAASKPLALPARSQEVETEREKKTLASPNGKATRKTPKPRPADEIWDALELLFGRVEQKTNAHARRNKATADLKRQHATCQDLQVAATKWPSLYPQATLTDIALATHFSQLLLATGRKPGQPQPVVCPDCGLGGNHHLDTCQRKDAHAHNAFA